MSARWLLLLTLATACTAAFRSQSGGATAPAGVSTGTSNSIYIGDRGGLLTRAGLTALGVVAAMGAVTVDKQETHIYTAGDEVWAETKTEGRINFDNAQAAADIMNAAADPKQNFGGLSAGLDIAAQTLGGDTSGWMFDFGFEGAATSRHSRFGWRAMCKFAFGDYTFHDRMIKTFSDGMVMMSRGDADYSFLGVISRVGITYRLPLSTTNVAMLEAFAQPNINFWGIGQYFALDTVVAPSPWYAGVRFSAMVVAYVEAKVGMSSLSGDRQSVGLEAGFAF